MTDGRSKRAKDRREERRAQILQAATHVFADKGYHDAAVSDLVEAAGVARGTFYQYFDSKHAVFIELLDDLLIHFRASVVGIDLSLGAASVPEQLVDTIARVLQAADSHRALATIVFREAVGLDASVEDRVHGFEERLLEYVRDALEQGRRVGLLKPHAADIVATLIFGGLRAVIDHYIVRIGETRDWQAVALAIVNHHLYGLLVEPGTP